MKTCPNCGQVSADEDRFCRMCGMPCHLIPGAPSSVEPPSTSPIPFDEHDRLAVVRFWNYGVLLLVASVLGVVDLLPLGLTFPVSTVLSLIVIALELAGAYFLRDGFKTLSQVDNPMFKSQVTFTSLYLVGLLVTAVHSVLSGYANPLSSLGTTQAPPGAGTDLLVFSGFEALLFTGGILTLAGVIGGVALGLWRVGVRYGRDWLRAASILAIFPVLNIAAAVAFVVIFDDLRSAPSRPPPHSAGIAPPKPSGHALRNLLILTVLVLVALILVGLFSSLKL